MKTIKRNKYMSKWANYIATDINGSTFCFNMKPEYVQGFWTGVVVKSSCITLNYEFKSYSSSLRKIVDKPSKKDKLIENQQKEIARCIGVSVYSIDKYNQRGYLIKKRQMLDLGALDDNFTFNDFMNDFKES